MFCRPETVDVSRAEAEGNIDSRSRVYKTYCFPEVFILLNTKSQRNEKIERTSYENT